MLPVGGGTGEGRPKARRVVDSVESQLTGVELHPVVLPSQLEQLNAWEGATTGVGQGAGLANIAGERPDGLALLSYGVLQGYRG